MSVDGSLRDVGVRKGSRDVYRALGRDAVRLALERLFPAVGDTDLK